MSLDKLKESVKDYAKDTRLNLGTVITSAQGLSEKQAWGLALASAYATRNHHVVENILADAAGKLSEAEIEASKSAATIMAMNNIYYRAVHLSGDEELGKMPAGLRMQVIGSPGIDKVDFELYALAVSAINGCGVCVEAHVKQAYNHGVTKQAVQSSLKIAAVLNAAAQADFIG